MTATNVAKDYYKTIKTMTYATSPQAKRLNYEVLNVNIGTDIRLKLLKCFLSSCFF